MYLRPFAGLLAVFLLLVNTVQAEFGAPRLASRSTSGVAADRDARNCSLSLAGRYVAFESSASNLTPNGLSSTSQIYLYDRRLQRTELISISAAGLAGDGASRNASVTSSGNYVLFESEASNLVSGDSNGVVDVFRWSRSTGKVDRVSKSQSGGQCSGLCFGGAISDDGRYVAFVDYSGGVAQVLRADIQTGSAPTVVSKASGTPGDKDSSGAVGISADGRYVVFTSRAANLGGSGYGTDVFLYDNSNGSLQLVSVPPSGQSFPTSGEVFSMGPGSIAIAPNGNVLVTFGADDSTIGTAGASVFLRNITTGVTTLVAKGNQGSEFLTLSADGSLGVFLSTSTDLSAPSPTGGAYLYDRASGALTLLHEADSVTDRRRRPCISQDGTVVGFEQGTLRQIHTREQDACPLDPNKENPFVCGCGIEDYDADLDGTFDCQDSCPNDFRKTAPGICGCGVIDNADSDGDGTEDCFDSCPADAAKTVPGGCGCGVPDTGDGDGDGVLDCTDSCAADPLKASGDTCGCGNRDVDLNANGTADCLETRLAKPRPAKVKIKGKSVTVTLPKGQNVRYRITLLALGRKGKTTQYTSNVVKLKRLAAGQYQLVYTLVDTLGTTPLVGPKSKAVRFQVK